MSKFPPEYSGPGVRMPKLYKWLRQHEENYKVQIICNGIEQIKNEYYFYDGFPVHRVTAEYLNKLFSILKFIPKKVSHFIIYQYEFIKTLFFLFFAKRYKNINLLHILGHSGGTAAALLFGNLKKIPVLIELVNSEADVYQKFFYFFKVKPPANSVVATLTKSSRDQLEKYGFSPDNLWFKPNPINSEKYNLNSVPKLKMDNCKGNNNILSIAKIIPRKNQIFLLEVLKLLPKNISLILAGPRVYSGLNAERDDLYFDDIKNRILNYELEDRVLLIDQHVDSEKYIKNSDVYLMPAWGEGFGTPMLEAMACGIPVVANKNETAFQEWIKDDNNGFLADISNPKDWADKILLALNISQTKKINMAKDVVNLAGYEKIFSDYLKIIELLLKR